MNASTDRASSRPLGVARQLNGGTLDEATAHARLVILTGESAILATANGRWAFLDALALLIRIVGRLVIVVPPDLQSLRHEVELYCARAWSPGSVAILDTPGTDLLEEACAILNVGTSVNSCLAWTAINSEGWNARVSSTTCLPAETGKPNPLGALMAASLGATEVFKRIFDVPHDVAPPFDATVFSLWDYSTSPANAGPALPAGMRWPDTLLNGAGAIGNASALLLAQLGVQGRLHVIDKQEYRDENLGTCILVDRQRWLDEPKAERLASWLRQHSAMTVTGERTTIERAIDESRFGDLRIDMVLNGFDDAGARRAAQRLWPSVIVDGGINEIGAAVVQYRLEPSRGACLMCWFDSQEVDSASLQSRLTGLSKTSLEDASRLISDADIASADASKRGWLRELQRQDRSICSAISQAQLESRLGVAVSDGFRPSVPFVASAAASLVVASAVKYQVFRDAPVVSKFQVGNLFVGLGQSASYKRRPNPRCQCVTQRDAIDRLKRNRDQSADPTRN